MGLTELDNRERLHDTIAREKRDAKIARETRPRTAKCITKEASLEGLLVELRALILISAPDIFTLRALSQSCPAYRTTFLSHKVSILSTFFLRDVTPEVLLDAITVYRAYTIWYQNEGLNRKHRVEIFLAEFEAERTSNLLTTCKGLDTKALDFIFHLHCSVTQIAEDFCKESLSSNPMTHEEVEHHGEIKISKNERRRIYRALYRFELFRTLFDVPREVNGVPAPHESLGYFDKMEQNLLFLCLYQPWEIEEIGCIHDYLVERNHGMIWECKDEILKFCPKKNLKYSYLMTHGLAFLCHLLNTPSKMEKAAILENRLRYSSFGFLKNALEELPWDYSMYYGPCRTAMRAGEKHLFENDDLVDAPNAGCIWAMEEKFCMCAYAWEHRDLRKWGHVMWDVGRLEEWGVLDANVAVICDYR